LDLTGLDDYIDTILSHMRIEAAQRDKIGQEFRSCLGQSVEEGIRKGLTHEKAEWDAAWALGELPLPVGKRTPPWFNLRTLIVSLLVIGSFLYSKDRQGFIVSSLVLLVFLLIEALYGGYWAEIDGGLRVRRFLRRPIQIPFGDIRRIRFEKLHLWGPRGLVIEHLNGSFHLEPEIQGMRIVAVVLRALCPDRMDKPVHEYLSNLPPQI